MHLCTLTKPVRDSRWNLEPGTYLCEDLSAFELAIAADRGTAKVQQHVNIERLPLRFNSITGERVGATSTLIISNCGFGDALMWTPTLRAFKEKFPDHALTFSTRARIHPVFDGLSFVPKLIDYPPKWDDAAQYDRVICSEHLQEDESEQAKTKPAIDIKAELLGVGPLVGGQRKSEYQITDGELAFALEKYPHTQKKRIGIQLQASSPSRTYHPQRASVVMATLIDKGYAIFLFGSPGSLPGKHFPEKFRNDPDLKNLTLDNLSFRQSCAVLKTCDAFWGPDSSLLHVAGCLEIPAVGIFASIHWSTRTSDYPSVIAVQSNIACDKAPCGWHPKGASVWKPGAICEKEGHCTPLNSIEPERVIAKIEKQLYK